MATSNREIGRLMAALPAAPPGLTPRELFIRHGIKQDTLRDGTLPRLVHEGRVQRAGRPYRYWKTKEDTMSTTPVPATNDGDFLSAQEAADYLRMSLAWVRLKTSTGELPHIKLGTRVLYSRDDLRAFAAGHRKGARKESAA